MRDGVAAAKADDRVRVLVLTGAGDRAFCAGADLGSGGIAGTEGHAASHDGRGLTRRPLPGPVGAGKPTIARVRGYALAGGFGLALACDFVIAADDAQFGTPEINVGLWPYMITVPLLRSMPPKNVLELMTTGRRVDAAEAERIGFVNRVVPVGDLDAAVDELAAMLASKSPLVMRWGRQAFYRVLRHAGRRRARLPPGDAHDHEPLRGHRRRRRRVRREARAAMEGQVGNGTAARRSTRRVAS